MARPRGTGTGAPGADAGALHKAGWFIYPFFAIHMLAFGLSGFFLAYGPRAPDLLFLYMHGGIAIVVYLVFYLTIFGRDQVTWMLLNAALGVLGIYAQVGWILARFGRRIGDYPWYVHVVPFMYYVLYTFLLRQFLIDATRSRHDARRRSIVDTLYVLLSLTVYGLLLLRR
ncbi:MAG: hypothetical protein KIS72_01240 [Luteimonas sp.]|nr:hypothetical protein [Luteimonas sp.]